MLSRVADSIYWMSRYVERAENLARFVDVTHNMTLDLPPGSAQQWGALVYASGDHEFFENKYGQPTRENVVQFLTFDRDYGDLIFKFMLSIPKGVIYFRFRPSTPEEPAEYILRLLAMSSLSLDGKFTVAERDRVRQRPLP